MAALNIVDYRECMRLLDHLDPVARLFGVYWLDIHPTLPLPAKIGRLLSDPDPRVVCRTLECIGNRQAYDFGPAVFSLFKQARGTLAGHCAFTLGKLKFAPAAGLIAERLLSADQVDGFLGQCFALSQIGGHQAETALLGALNVYGDDYFREFILVALLQLKQPRIYPQIVDQYLNSEQSYLEGRDLHFWLWQSAGIGHWRNAGAIGGNPNLKPGDWLQNLARAQKEEKLFQFSKQWSGKISFKPRRDALSRLTQFYWRTVTDNSAPDPTDPAWIFIEHFYNRRLWLIDRLPGLLCKEAIFLTACFAKVMTSTRGKAAHDLTDDEILGVISSRKQWSKPEVIAQAWFRIEKLGAPLIKIGLRTKDQHVLGEIVDLLGRAVQERRTPLSEKLMDLFHKGLLSSDEKTSKTAQAAMAACDVKAVHYLLARFNKGRGPLADNEARLLGTIPCRESARILLDSLDQGRFHNADNVLQGLIDLGCLDTEKVLLADSKGDFRREFRHLISLFQRIRGLGSFKSQADENLDNAVEFSATLSKNTDNSDPSLSGKVHSGGCILLPFPSKSFTPSGLI